MSIPEVEGAMSLGELRESVGGGVVVRNYSC